MSALTHTGALTRLALRLDRVRLPLWILVIGVMPAATAANYRKLYPTGESLNTVTGVLDNPSLVAIGGPLFRATLGGLTTWKISATAFILAGLMSIFTVTRHTRANEETGRLELLGATVIGRYAPLSAALTTAALANAGIVTITTLGLIVTGLPAAGSIALGLSIGLVGLACAATAAVTAQLTATARAANGTAAAVLGASYLARAIGDTGPTWLSWTSPLGWAMRLRPYADEQWWITAPLIAFTVTLITTAYTLTARRDLSSGPLTRRPAAATAGPALRNSLGLAWRLHRGALLGWTIAMALAGAAMGGATHGIATATNLSQQMLDVMARMGGHTTLVNEFLAAVSGIAGLIAAAYTTQITARLRAEESRGGLEPLLAARVGRIPWTLSHITVAALGAALLLAVFGAGAGLTYGAQTHDIAGQTVRLTGAALVQLPAVWVLVGLSVALFGLVPRLSALTWAALIACVLLAELGAILGLSHWIVDMSPFAHIPKTPGAPFASTPLLWLTGIAGLLTAGGLIGFRRRDIR